MLARRVGGAAVVVALVLIASCRSREQRKTLAAKAAPYHLVEAPALTKGKGVMKPGSYWGFVRLHDQDVKLPLAFDLVETTTPGQGQTFQGVMKLMLGGFDTSEYVTMFLSEVKFDKAKSRIDFMASDDEAQHLGLTGGTLRGGQVITGSVTRLGAAAPVGDLIAVYQSRATNERLVSLLAKAYPDHRVAPLVRGEFQGMCANDLTSVELLTGKVSSPVVQTGKLDGYRIAAQWTRTDPFACRDQSQPDCLKTTIRPASFNYLTQVLTLADDKSSCQLEAGHLVCGECRLARVPAGDGGRDAATVLPDRYERQLTAMGRGKSKRARRANAPSAQPEGDYFGYLHHETLDDYQSMRLKFTKASDGQSAELIATLFFGEFSGREFLVFRFPVSQDGAIERGRVLTSDGDAFVQILNNENDVLRGLWFAKSQGRVGTFEVKKAVLPHALLATTHRVPKLSDRYRGNSWQFELYATSGLSAKPADFSPLPVVGTAEPLAATDTTARMPIKRVSYNFYRRELWVEFDDNRGASGTVSEDGVALHWPEKAAAGAVVAGQTPTPDVQFFKREESAAVRSARIRESEESLQMVQ